MKEIFLYPAGITILMYFLGYGIASYLTPKKIAFFAFWLAPWYTIVGVSVGLTILSLMGIPIAYSTIPLTLVLATLSLKTWFYDKIRVTIGWREVILASVVGVSILVNLAPLWRNDKILTTVSLGNNDAIIYATVPEYLQKGTIFSRLLVDGHEGKYDYNGISNLIRIGYRWGTPITMGYLLEVTGLRGYQFTYLFQVLLFAWMIPLVYVLLVVMTGKESKLGLILTAGLTAANANLLYMLYHNFAGQVFFWGLQLLFWIHVFSKKSERNDFLIGIIVASVFYSYHEGSIFLLAPFGIYLLISRNWQTMWRVATTTLLLGGVAAIHSIMFDIQQAQLVNGPIGWDIFRKINPFANPVELLGLWDIHTSPALPWIVAWSLSGLILVILARGMWKASGRGMIMVMVGLYLPMIVWTTWGNNNFFAYNRVVTYVLPVVLPWFVAGWIDIADKKRYLGLGVGVILIVASLWSGGRLIRRFTYNHITVDRSLMSLSELANNPSITEPIYLSEVVEGMGYYWRQIWTEYFLYPQKELVSSANLQEFKNGIVPEDALILVSKELWYRPPKLLFEQVVWENGFYKLGRRCLSDDCLLKNSKQLQTIEFGKTQYDDTILIDGWSTPENDHRWANEKTASIWWVTEKNMTKTQLKITATSFIDGQTVRVFVNDELCRKLALSREWSEYTIELPKVQLGKHLVSFEFDKVENPDAASGDKRELAVDFRRISFE
ncbi:MAG: hypothetical protein ABII21_04350 [bacterium]